MQKDYGEQTRFTKSTKEQKYQSASQAKSSPSQASQCQLCQYTSQVKLAPVGSLVLSAHYCMSSRKMLEAKMCVHISARVESKLSNK